MFLMFYINLLIYSHHNKLSHNACFTGKLSAITEVEMQSDDSKRRNPCFIRKFSAIKRSIKKRKK